MRSTEQVRSWNTWIHHGMDHDLAQIPSVPPAPTNTCFPISRDHSLKTMKWWGWGSSAALASAPRAVSKEPGPARCPGHRGSSITLPGTAPTAPSLSLTQKGTRSVYCRITTIYLFYHYFLFKGLGTISPGHLELCSAVSCISRNHLSLYIPDDKLHLAIFSFSLKLFTPEELKTKIDFRRNKEEQTKDSGFTLLFFRFWKAHTSLMNLSITYTF